MTALKFVSLWCDHADCADADSFANGIGGYQTVAEIRRVAASDGWTRRNGKDYCSEHSGGSAPTEEERP
jgi:hypothetical protein